MSHDPSEINLICWIVLLKIFVATVLLYILMHPCKIEVLTTYQEVSLTSIFNDVYKVSGCHSPCVSEVSDALRPSRKLMGERLCVSLLWALSACMVGLAGRVLMKGKVMRVTGVLARTTSLREGASSSRLRSLCIEPMSYSESTLPREGLWPTLNRLPG